MLELFYPLIAFFVMSANLPDVLKDEEHERKCRKRIDEQETTGDGIGRKVERIEDEYHRAMEKQVDRITT